MNSQEATNPGFRFFGVVVYFVMDACLQSWVLFWNFKNFPEIQFMSWISYTSRNL